MSDFIRIENEKPGTADWLLSHVRLDPNERHRCPWIEGYSSKTSLRAGESLEIMVSTKPPSPFVIDFYRLGYYQGKGGRHILRLGPFKGMARPVPQVGKERLRQCQWEPAVSITIPQDWLSGVYLAKLTAEKEKVQSYVIFIVRDDRSCDFLFQCSDTTWAAYNGWPSGSWSNGWSLYHDGKKRAYWGPGLRVSWDRPYSLYEAHYPRSLGSGQFLLWEFPLAFWMEKEGYDVSYISNLDTHTDPKGLLRAKGWLSVGHDEYWSLDMFNNIKAAIDAGVNLAFFSGNTCNGVIAFYPNSHGIPNRIISRVGQFGPIDARNFDHGFPEMRKFKEDYPDEVIIIGARNTFPWWGVGDWVCTDETHWIYEKTGMKNGDRIPGLVGWEWHGDPADDMPGLRVVATGPTKGGAGGADGIYTATIYQGPKGNFIFNASSIWWAKGLSQPPGYPMFDGSESGAGAGPKEPDSRVQRITANILNRFYTTRI